MMFGVVVEEQLRFTLIELSRASEADPRQLADLVTEGVLIPTGHSPRDWQFEGSALRHTRAVMRLSRDLDLNVADAALVWGLLEEIAALKARLRRIEV